MYYAEYLLTIPYLDSGLNLLNSEGGLKILPVIEQVEERLLLQSSADKTMYSVLHN
jgi:hypothetical protein